MYRIALVNMPFGNWHLPSLALAQLAAVVRERFGDAVSVDVCYLNHDFAELFGVELYEDIAFDAAHMHTGVGDWFFRQVAFPEEPDNTEAYFRRYYRGDQWRDFRAHLRAMRAELPGRLDDLVDRYGLADADVVGFTSMFAQHVANIAVARLVKARRPGITTVLGGANCEAPMGAVIAGQVPVVDFVFSGPALVTFPDFIGLLLAGDRDAADVLPGVLSRRNCDDPRYGKAIGPDRPIVDVVWPDYDSYLSSLRAHPDLVAHSTRQPSLLFEMSRGCWWGERSHCTFCGLNSQSMGYRSLPPAQAVEQFQRLFTYAPEIKVLVCTDNIMPRAYPQEVFPLLEPPPGTTIFYEVKVPTSRRDLASMRAAGMTSLQPGIESLATSTLKLMAKGTTAFQNIQFLKACRDLGIRPDWHLLIGFPGEETGVYAKYHDDMPSLGHLHPPMGVFLVRFDRYSPYFHRADEFGLELRPMDFYPLVYPFPPDQLQKLAYYFVDDRPAGYALGAARWHGRLYQRTSAWNAGWDAGDGEGPQLAVVQTPSGRVIRDTRGGDRRDHVIDDMMLALLRVLCAPMRPERLPTVPSLAAVADLDRRVDWLRGHHMLFEEAGKVLSLVTGVEGGSDEVMDMSDRRKRLTLTEKGSE